MTRTFQNETTEKGEGSLQEKIQDAARRRGKGKKSTRVKREGKKKESRAWDRRNDEETPGTKMADWETLTDEGGKKKIRRSQSWGERKRVMSAT